MIQHTRPYRLCNYNPNPCIGRNSLADVLPVNIWYYFDDITDDLNLLREAYVTERHDPFDGGIMNRQDPAQFCDNRIARWSDRQKKWVPKEGLTDRILQIRHLIPDAAELNLLDELVELAGLVLSHSTLADERQWIGPTKRLLFVQGGIGSGKSTLLHHFSRILIPDLSAKSLLPYRFLTATADFDRDDAELNDL